MRRALIALPLLVVLAACQPPAEAKKTQAATAEAAGAKTLDLMAGTYRIDPDHATILFRVDHVGMSKWTAQFRKFDASLALDPDRPEASSVTAQIDVASLDSKTSPALAFDKTLTGPDWLDAGAHPKITFKSTRIERTGPNTADVAGDLTLKGVTRPVVLKTTFNDGYKPNAMDGARIGFSAHTRFNRSDFGINYGIPAPGSKMGVSDEVEVIIEAEFIQGEPTGATPHP